MTKRNRQKEKLAKNNYQNEDKESIIRFVKILIGVIIFIVLVYFATRLFVKKDLIDNKETSVTEVSYSKMVFGTMLNRPYEEYYVYAYSSESNKAYYYSTFAEKYMNNDKNSLYVYYVDLEDAMNKKYVSANGETNPKAKSIEDLRVGELTLIKVKNGKIVKYLETIEDVKSEFGI